MCNKIKEWFISKPVVRWILFFPIAWISSIIGNLLWELLSRIIFIFMPTDSLFFKIFNYSFSGLFTGIIFMYVGVYIAPAKKKSISILLLILTILHSFITIFDVFFIYLEKDYWIILFAIFLIFGSVFSFLIINEKKNNNE